MAPSIAIIIINYNKAQDTIECVRSLKSITYPSVNIIVLDNGSTDDSAEVLKSLEPGIYLLRSTANMGFAAGNNYAYRFALTLSPEYVLLLNNDTLVEPDFLEPMVDSLENDNRALIAGGSIEYFPQKETLWYAGGTYIPWRASCFSRQTKSQNGNVKTDVELVSFITGCLMLVRVGGMDNPDLFDERYFMYFEDADLCVRSLTRGYHLLYVPSARIYHKVCHAGDTPFTMYYGVRNRLLFIRVRMKGWQRLVATIYFSVIMRLKMLYWVFENKNLFHAAKQGWKDYYKGVFYKGSGSLFLKDDGGITS